MLAASLSTGLTREQIVGSHQWTGDIDLINIMLIGIKSNPPEKDENYELHRLIGTVFSLELTEQEKIDIFEKEYDIDCNPDVRSEVRLMCNLSQGIKESGIKEGSRQEKTQTVLNMYEEKCPLDQICRVTKLPLDKVQEIIDNSMALV